MIFVHPRKYPRATGRDTTLKRRLIDLDNNFVVGLSLLLYYGIQFMPHRSFFQLVPITSCHALRFTPQ